MLFPTPSLACNLNFKRYSTRCWESGVAIYHHCVLITLDTNGVGVFTFVDLPTSPLYLQYSTFCELKRNMARYLVQTFKRRDRQMYAVVLQDLQGSFNEQHFNKQEISHWYFTRFLIQMVHYTIQNLKIKNIPTSS